MKKLSELTFGQVIFITILLSILETMLIAIIKGFNW